MTALIIDLAVDCRLCGNTSHIQCEEWQVIEMNKPRSERMFMQDIFPNLSIGDRELLISGTCDTCWQELFGSCEDEEE
jgi:hypothetical protein